MRTIASIWFPHWSINRWTRAQPGWQTPAHGTQALTIAQPDSPFALTETVNQTQKLHAVSTAAHTCGLMSGMTLAEARAMIPELETAPANSAADAHVLLALARWCDRYTPLVAIDGTDGLLLDITGCGHLFGSDNGLINDLITRLGNAGFQAKAATAETVGAAWALSRYGSGTTSSPDNIETALKPLPVKALRLDAGSINTLHRLGLKRIGDIISLPRTSLARRFRGKPQGQVSDLLMRLDQALGVKTEPIDPLSPLPLWRIRHAFSEPILHLATIETALPTMLADLMQTLARADTGVRRLDLHAFRVDGSVQTLQIGTNRPTRGSDHLMRLFDEKLQTLEAGFGFDLLMLSVNHSETLTPAQITTVKDTQTETTAKVLDRLSARLGSGAVVQIKHRHSHIPERAQSYMPALQGDLGLESLPLNLAPRPLRLLLRPEAMQVMAEVPEGAPRRFRWRKVDHKVTRSEGPERIAPEWWLRLDDSENLLTRDYYRIEVEAGARFWVFRHGLYEVPGVRKAETIDDPLHGNVPRWFMHGFFA